MEAVPKDGLGHFDYRLPFYMGSLAGHCTPGNVGMAGDNQNDRVVIFDDKNVTAAAELRFCNLQ